MNTSVSQLEIIETEVVVLGGGPAGYPAAFRASDLGKKVVLIDPEPNPGGVCLYRGCIPSKALLHVGAFLDEAKESQHFGVTLGPAKIDLDQLRSYKNQVVQKITKGVGTLTKSRKIQHIQGLGKFEDSHHILVTKTDGSTLKVHFQNAIIAAGSRPFMLPAFDLKSDRIMTSTEALELPDIPQKLLCIGGGVIGMELATVYSSLGSEVTVVELLPQILTGADPDLVKVLENKLKSKITFSLKTKVASLSLKGNQVEALLELEGGQKTPHLFDRVLVSMGRKSNVDLIGIENTAVSVDTKGFITIDNQCRSSENHIYAIGDITGNPMLAHRGTHQGHIAAEVICGKKVEFNPLTIPSVVYTNPEIAWCGLTEDQAKKDQIPHQVTKFPWAASGRATAVGRTDGLTKILFHPETGQVLGVGMAGINAGELLGEGLLAVEMGALASDIAHTIHPHPTLAETLMEASELFLGHCDHYFVPKKK